MSIIISILLIPFVNTGIIIGNIVKYKMKKESLEFKTVVVMMTAFLIMAIMIQIPSLSLTVSMGFMDFAFQLLIFLSVGFIVISFGVDFTVRNIIKQQALIKKQSERLSDIIKKSSYTSTNVSNKATELSASSSEINTSAEEISSTVLEITLKIQRQVNDFKEMDEMLKNIDKITKTITEISERTNLLALNASIEAGRVGDAGRGFMVVASKVQQLAENSKKSVEETKNIVNDITNKIKNASSNITDISKGMTEISTATEEQSSSLEEINKTLIILEEDTVLLTHQLEEVQETE